MKYFAPGRRRQYDQAGDTLIEVLFTLVIVGICAAGLLGAFSTSLSASAEQRGLVTLNTLVRDGSAELYSDFQSTPGDYVPCASTTATPPSYQALVASLPLALPSGYTDSISSIQYLNVSTGQYQASCASSTAPELLTFNVGGPYSTGGTTSFVVQDIHPQTFPAYELKFLTAPVTGGASSSATVGPITVQEVDASGNPSTTPITVNLASSSAGPTYFATSSGGTAITSVTIPSGSSTATFYYGDAKLGTPTITASSNGLISATQQETIVPGVATTLKITSTPVSGVASATATLGQITVTEYDQFGNLSTSFENVGLSSNSSGTSEFATQSGGPTVISVTIPSGSSSATFYYGDTMAGTPTITASASGLTSGTQQETILAGAAKTLKFTSPPVSGAAATTATLGQITVEEVDAFGNVSTAAETVGLATSSTGTSEFATSLNGVAVTSVSIPAGSSTASFYYGDTQAGTPTIAASASGLNSGTQQETIIADAAKSLKFTSSPVSGPAAASATLGQITVTEYDQFGNLSTTAETVGLTSSSTGTFEFASSLNGTAVSSVPIPSGSSTASFYYGDTQAGTPTITAAASGLTSATQQETVSGPSLPSISSPTAASQAGLKKNKTGLTVTITGSAFTSNATVSISGAVVTITKTTFNSSSSITVTVNTANSTGTFNLTVTDPGVGSAMSNNSIVVSS